MADTRNVDMSAITVSSKILGEILGVGDRMVRNLADENIVVRNSHGKYLLMTSVKNYILLLKASKAGKHVESHLDETLDLDTEKAKHEHIKCIIADINLALIRGKVHKSEDVERVITHMLGKFKSRMEAIPSKLARKLENKSRAEIQEVLRHAISEALSELSEYNPADYYADEYIDEDDCSDGYRSVEEYAEE